MDWPPDFKSLNKKPLLWAFTKDRGHGVALWEVLAHASG